MVLFLEYKYLLFTVNNISVSYFDREMVELQRFLHVGFVVVVIGSSDGSTVYKDRKNVKLAGASVVSYPVNYKTQEHVCATLCANKGIACDGFKMDSGNCSHHFAFVEDFSAGSDGIYKKEC